MINFSPSDLDDPNNKSNFMLNLDRSINFKENKTFQDLIINNKLNLNDNNLRLTSLKMESQFVFDSEKEMKNENSLNANNEEIKY